MSAKGQLVVPQSARESAGYKEGDRFIATITPEGITFRKLNLEKITAEFEKTTRNTREHIKQQRVTQKDAAKAIRWARRS